MGCRQTIESLIPRVEGLAKSLNQPVPEDEIREQARREVLKRYPRDFLRDQDLADVHNPPPRKLEVVLQDLIPLAKRGKVTRFLNSVEDVDKLGGLAEDIRDAMMDYQVCSQSARSHPT